MGKIEETTAASQLFFLIGAAIEHICTTNLAKLAEGTTRYTSRAAVALEAFGDLTGVAIGRGIELASTCVFAAGAAYLTVKHIAIPLVQEAGEQMSHAARHLAEMEAGALPANIRGV